MAKQVHFSLKPLAGALGVLVVLTFVSCGKEDIDMFDCTGSNPTYTADIKAILDVSCANPGCHNAQTKENGFDFSSYIASKQAIQAGSFLGAIQHKRGFIAMPEDSPKLSDDKIRLLSCWVQNGTPE